MPVPRWSVYLRQVEQIPLPELIGRQAELAGFCLDESPGPVAGPYAWWRDRTRGGGTVRVVAGPYAWWRAPAWAGKSALLSTFVLHPPEPVADRVRIVSFFITARLAVQDTRDAFTQVVLEQLAVLTGQDVLPALPTRRLGPARPTHLHRSPRPLEHRPGRTGTDSSHGREGLCRNWT